MRFRRSALAVSLAAALFLPAISLASSFTVIYTFTGSLGSQASEPADSQPVGALFADITRGAGLTPNAGADSINSVGFTTGGLDPTEYYQFIATPDASYAMDLTSLEFSERRSATGIHAFEIRSSLDGFTASLYTFAVPDDTLTRRHNVALGAAFQDLMSAVTFRVYGYLAEAGTGSWRLGIAGGGDNPQGFAANFVVSGDLTQVPEPATLLWIGAGLSALRLRRRRA
jgi:hypothetical protein